jgi:lipase
MPTLLHEGRSVAFADSGDGDPVVLLHAGASSGRQWEKVAAQLPPRYRLLAPDLIGFGDTPAWDEPRELTHDDQAGVVRALVEQRAGSPVHVVGHSYGGATAIRFVLAVPDLVRRLVLIEPVVMPLLAQAGAGSLYDEYERVARRFVDDADAGRHEAAMSFFIDYRNGEGTWATASDTTRERLLAVTPQTADAYRSNLNNPTTLAGCAGVTAPTLLISGAETTEPERAVTEILAEQLPNARHEVVPEAGHMSPLTHPEEIARLIAEHLDAS